MLVVCRSVAIEWMNGLRDEAGRFDVGYRFLVGRMGRIIFGFFFFLIYSVERGIYIYTYRMIYVGVFFFFFGQMKNIFRERTLMLLA